MPERKAQQLQLVWFVNGQPDIVADGFYEDLIGTKPLNVNMTQAPAPPGGAMWTAGGHDKKFSYQLQMQIGRIDLTVFPAPASDNILENNFPLIENASQAIEKIRDLALRGAKRLGGKAHRVAMTGQFPNLASTVAKANADVAERLGLTGIGENTTDLSFQLNRRQAVPGLEGTEINRLLRLSVGTFQLVNFNVASGGALLGVGQPFNAPVVPTVTQTWAAILQLDLNTAVPPAALFTTAEQTSIFRHCASEMTRMLRMPPLEALA